jgi:hypothetical protein
MAEEIMKIIVSQYNNPKKVSEVQDGIRAAYDIKAQDPSLAESLRADNLQLQVEIYDMQDQILEMEKEYEEIKEDEI